MAEQGGDGVTPNCAGWDSTRGKGINVQMNKPLACSFPMNQGLCSPVTPLVRTGLPVLLLELLDKEMTVSEFGAFHQVRICSATD